MMAPAVSLFEWEALSASVLSVAFVGGGLAMYVNSTIRTQLLEFRKGLIAELNGTYVRAAECGLRHEEMVRRIDKMEGAG